MCFAEESGDERVTRRSLLAGGAAALADRGQGEKTPPPRVLDNPRVSHGKVTFQHNGQETISGYLARPKAVGAYPAVLVIAGNKISEEYIPNTCAALALAGFVGLAPDVFHPIPESARTNTEYEKYAGGHTELDRLDDVQAGASYLRAQPFVRSGGMGVLGFCRGGREALLFAARSREIDAALTFHPAPVRREEIRRLRGVPVQIHHGTADRSVGVDNTRSLEKALRAQGTPVEVFLYEGADHGFLAYTRPFYRPDDARLAWERTTQFLKRHLK